MKNIKELKKELRKVQSGLKESKKHLDSVPERIMTDDFVVNIKKTSDNEIEKTKKLCGELAEQYEKDSINYRKISKTFKF